MPCTDLAGPCLVSKSLQLLGHNLGMLYRTWRSHIALDVGDKTSPNPHVPTAFSPAGASRASLFLKKTPPPHIIVVHNCWSTQLESRAQQFELLFSSHASRLRAWIAENVFSISECESQ